MDMKIKANDNKVTFVMRTGKHFVQNTMPLSSAEQIIKSGKVVKDEQVAALRKDAAKAADKAVAAVKHAGQIHARGHVVGARAAGQKQDHR